MFWKDYGKTIRRLWLNEFGAVAFGIMLSFLSSTLSSKMPEYKMAVYVISGLLGLFFYIYLIYLVVWELGSSDRIKADAGRIPARPNLGLKIGLVYAIPSLAVTGIYLVLTVLYGAAHLDVPALNGTLNVFGLASLVIEAPYLGFALAIFGNIGKNLAENMLVYYGVFWFVTCIPMIVGIWAAYLLGYKGKLMSRLYKRKKD